MELATNNFAEQLFESGKLDLLPAIQSLQEEGEIADAAPAEAEEEGGLGGMLLALIAYPVLAVTVGIKSLIVALYTLPVWSILASINLVDLVLDWVFLITFGLFCKKCAGLFIWIINLAHLPLTVLGWVQRLFYEAAVVPIDGWLLLLGGSGCVLRFGRHCWLGGRWKNRPMRHKLDIPWFSNDSILDQIKDSIVPPAIEEPKDILAARRQSRVARLGHSPVLSTMFSAIDTGFEYIGI